MGNTNMNRVIICIASVLIVTISSTIVECDNDNLDFIRENFKVYRDNITAVNIGIPVCSSIPVYLDQIELTILGPRLDGPIELNISCNIRFLTINKRASGNITINATKTVNIERLELRSQANWFLLNVNQDFFSYFPKLTHLYAENIILRDLPSFTNRTDITRIQVVKSRFTDTSRVQVNGSFVSGLANLRLLWWKDSTISSLSTDAFGGLTALTELSFERNELQGLIMNQFVNLTNLLELDLSHNNLTTGEVQSGAFTGLSTLTNLAINSNPFFAPRITTFHPMYNLREIYIQNNMYIQLDFRAFEQKQDLTQIYLTGDNMFICSCEGTEWMQIASSRFDIEFIGGRCDLPVEFLNVDVTDMSIYGNTTNGLVCPVPPPFSYACFKSDSFTGQNFISSNLIGHNCSVDQVCVDTFDSFRCACTDGLIVEVNTETGVGVCVDENECANSTRNDCQQICVNSEGSFTCRCREGFTINTADDRRCDDIDECISTNPMTQHDCRENNTRNDSLCNNTLGGFNCSCRDGFEPKPSDQNNCKDIDECLITNDCNQTCINLPGNYECMCIVGFKFNTSAMPILRVGNDTSGSKGLPCVDLDECSTENPCDQLCNNTIGSFICSCIEGYNLNNQTICINIDECALNSTLCDLSRGMRCNDTKGSFECICLDGHVLDAIDNTTCVLIATGLSSEEIAGVSVAGFVLGAFFIAILIVVVYVIFLRSRSRVTLKRNDSEEKVMQNEEKIEMPQIIIDSVKESIHNEQDRYEEVGPAVEQSDAYANQEAITTEENIEPKQEKETEESDTRDKKKEIAEGENTGAAVSDQDEIRVAEAVSSDDLPKYRDVLV